MKKKVMLGVVLAGLVGGGVWLAFFTGCADPTVKQPYKEEDLNTDQIRAKLNSPDFKEQLEGKKQIDKLPPDDKRKVLLVLADDPKPSTRIMAVQKLKTVDHPDARAKLEKLAREDADATVRELAGEK